MLSRITRRVMPPFELVRLHLERATRPNLVRLAVWLGMSHAPEWSDRALLRRVRRVTRQDQRPKRVLREHHLRDARPQDLERLADYCGVSVAGWGREALIQLTWRKVDARGGSDTVGDQELDDG
jgi:hypothetical protein